MERRGSIGDCSGGRITRLGAQMGKETRTIPRFPALIAGSMEVFPTEGGLGGICSLGFEEFEVPM